MTVDPMTRAILDQMQGAFPSLSSLSPEETRRRVAAAPRPSEVEHVHQVTDRTIPGPDGPIPVRIYRPADGPAPVIVFYHGGGWVICNLDTHDALCRSLANGTGAVVVSVDYRLAPEHPFPAAADDAYAAAVWVAEHGAELDVDTSRLAVAGDSAGGNLAAAVALMAKDKGGPAIGFQLLIYPVTSPDLDTASYRENATGYYLTHDDMVWFWAQYEADPARRRHPYAAPLLAPDLSGLPPAHVVTAEHDPLRDEGEAYANRLREAGVSATNTRYGGMFHGFFSMAAILPAAGQALESSIAVLRRALATSS